jgi:hypothetical protein
MLPGVSDNFHSRYLCRRCLGNSDHPMYSSPDISLAMFKIGVEAKLCLPTLCMALIGNECQHIPFRHGLTDWHLVCLILDNFRSMIRQSRISIKLATKFLFCCSATSSSDRKFSPSKGLYLRTLAFSTSAGTCSVPLAKRVPFLFVLPRAYYFPFMLHVVRRMGSKWKNQAEGVIGVAVGADS